MHPMYSASIEYVRSVNAGIQWALKQTTKHEDRQQWHTSAIKSIGCSLRMSILIIVALPDALRFRAGWDAMKVHPKKPAERPQATSGMSGSMLPIPTPRKAQKAVMKRIHQQRPKHTAIHLWLAHSQGSLQLTAPKSTHQLSPTPKTDASRLCWHQSPAHLWTAKEGTIRLYNGTSKEYRLWSAKGIFPKSFIVHIAEIINHNTQSVPSWDKLTHDLITWVTSSKINKSLCFHSAQTLTIYLKHALLYANCSLHIDHNAAHC